MWLTVIHVETDRNRVDNVRHPPDVIGMGMCCYQEVDLLYTQFFQGRHGTASASVYECSLSFRGTDEDGISLTHVEECDSDRFANRTKDGGTTSPSG